ncbi:MAG: Acylphosphatase [uncultured bacterium]|nr:MAG: Acylphosphatase [uncultured bacterium]OGJ48194.1 MAG: hypothetical protein A2344_01150 [Candidatus Peregrinibacteria bacterium RIFOXYB12_FULL_41_12]OGJ48306.1 MAG: hypothetical protein A2244_02210 [Candidatus Peregrinibacteria bacterium RIFOXYA2_FULL_41_18]OGJ53458.1 MAG: hypothetical protein A2448_02870 [Candidatus Peregrinibacteria bacterium RIFOXYC2_FULL_41_22]OGJ54307.1 MAG: hypothetical protein A2336_00745 [Candidatus Peregrinibacteria bacterium RIFOXYB2_FULL_41_88]
MIAYKLTIAGHVQGVWFRQFTIDAALSFGITGWVKNDPEGTVSAFIQGDGENLDSLIKLLGKGPDLAEVKSISKSAATPDASIVDFSIKH